MKKIILAALIVVSAPAAAKGWGDGGWMNGWCHGSLAKNFPVPFGLAC
jgi:hypothetical protein